MKKKKQYRVKNWREYNESLKRRGSLTVWLEPSVLTEWQSPSGGSASKRGRPYVYSDRLIELLLVLGVVYHQRLRQTEGLGRSLAALLQIEVSVPDYSTLCRRRQKLTVKLPRVSLKEEEELHVVVDSTGIKVLGAGEWQRKRYKQKHRRMWRKLHLAVDSSIGELLSALVSSSGLHDGHGLPMLLEDIDRNVKKVGADGIYDIRAVYDCLAEHDIEPIIPPRRNARVWYHGNRKSEPHPRDAALRHCRKHGRKHWKQQSGYHRRSIAETAMSRYKRIIAERVWSRRFEAQATEILLGCSVLNSMLSLGAPQSYLVA